MTKSDGYDVPQDVNAERAVLGGILLENAGLEAVQRVGLKAEDFYSDSHRIVFEAMVQLSEADQPIDTVTLRDWIVGCGGVHKLEALTTAGGVRGDEMLLSLTDTIPTLANIVAHARIVQEKAVRRRLRHKLLQAAVAAVKGEISDAHELATVALGERLVDRVPFFTGRDAVWEALTSVGKQQGGSLVRTGFPVLDSAYKSMRRGTMMVIGGRTNSGKSKLMLCAALDMARAGLRPLIVSTEDPAELWGERLACQLVPELSDERIRSGQRTFDEQERSARALRLAHEAGLTFSYQLNKPFADVLRAVRQGCEEGHRVIVLDYIQAIRFAVSGHKRGEVISHAAQTLKATVQEHNAVLVLGSQTRRPDAAKPFAEPTAYELKETGDLENCADVIVMLWKTSDESDAKHLAKVAKVKWNWARPRVQLHMAQNGALSDVTMYTPPAFEGRGWGSSGGRA